MAQQAEVGVQDFVLMDEITMEKFMDNLHRRWVTSEVEWCLFLDVRFSISAKLRFASDRQKIWHVYRHWHNMDISITYIWMRIWLLCVYVCCVSFFYLFISGVALSVRFMGIPDLHLFGFSFLWIVIFFLTYCLYFTVGRWIRPLEKRVNGFNEFSFLLSWG